MARIRPSIILAGLLILAILIPQAIEANSCTLLPPSIISTENFTQLMSAVHIGKDIYRMDAFERFSTDDIKRRLATLLTGPECPVFDVEKMGFMKKGFTRHYLFTITGKSLVMRICLKEELALQPEIPAEDIIISGEIESVKAVYQVFDLTKIIESRKTSPRDTFHSRETERYS